MAAPRMESCLKKEKKGLLGVCTISVPSATRHLLCKALQGVGDRWEHLLTLGETWRRKEEDGIQEVVEKGLDTGRGPPVRYPAGQGWDEALLWGSGHK